MTDREKLIKALQKNATCIELGMKSCDSCQYGRVEDCYTYALVDHLLANGVTFQKWIPVSERLPESGGRYIVAANDGHAIRVTFADLQVKIKSWYLTGARAYWKVTHWMPLPEPPGGGRK